MDGTMQTGFPGSGAADVGSYASIIISVSDGSKTIP